MHPSTNTRSIFIKDLTISTETTTIPTSSSSYIQQTEFTTNIDNIINDLFDNFDAIFEKRI